ncbi:aromatic ring-hydroxylating dioxygenase subunit alpha [Sphingosinicellaceae bacterium]|nr:aromatic ring-hydroxylating dioxygenase subunit alpha [Sphingosinicellaceae bacterium]
MYLRSCWYVAALAHEITRLGPVARTLLDEKIVLFRTLDGRAAALQDRCPHRFAPLSAGQVGAHGIACGYHGMTFDGQGTCIANPTQAALPIAPRTKVRSYPIVERHGFLWIWMGDAGLADPSDIPDYHCCDSPDWNGQTSYLHVKANYLFLVDNLLDLTHINFVHGDVLGNPEMIGNMVNDTELRPDGVTERWLSPSAPAVPAWRAIINQPWMEGNVDFWLDMDWAPASNMILDVGVKPPGADRSEGSGIVNVNCVTPETATTAHYFYGAAIKAAVDNVNSVPFWAKAQAYAFAQDRLMIEALQANIGDQWDILEMRPAVNVGDRAALHARRVLRRLIARETRTPEREVVLVE